ncbi:unknown (plasmid) [Halobacterium salinarum NRC-1]|uniref:Spurious ORF n=1 Tax=Halobacterium salinarum (strain ATCC 700922 / JCM 11081 / NRC-1) TaxID=64091 RepID=O51958_HALSA|nr:unknown [Halobacterium salinarum NRC-1]DAC79476.1 TPA_inf: spurious ORF [Halobacterium salinarum NRC-1]
MRELVGRVEAVAFLGERQERVRGHCRLIADLAVQFQLHEDVHKSPAVVQHAGEREVEVPEPVVGRLRLCEERLQFLEAVLDTPTPLVSGHQSPNLVFHLLLVGGIDIHPREIRLKGQGRRFDPRWLVDLLLFGDLIEKVAQRRVAVAVLRERRRVADVLEVLDEFLSDRHIRPVVVFVLAFPLALREVNRLPRRTVVQSLLLDDIEVFVFTGKLSDLVFVVAAGPDDTGVEVVDVVRLADVFDAVRGELAVHHHQIESRDDVGCAFEEIVYDIRSLSTTNNRDGIKDQRDVVADEFDDCPLEERPVIALVAENPRLLILSTTIAFHVAAPRVALREVDGRHLLAPHLVLRFRSRHKRPASLPEHRPDALNAERLRLQPVGVA